MYIDLKDFMWFSSNFILKKNIVYGVETILREAIKREKKKKTSRIVRQAICDKTDRVSECEFHFFSAIMWESLIRVNHLALCKISIHVRKI